MFGLTDIEAAQKLNADFNLNLSDKKPARVSQKSMAKIQDDKRLVEEFKEWENWAFSVLCSRCREINIKSMVLLKTDDPNLQRHIAELTEQSFINWLCDTMIENLHNPEKQIEFYENYGKLVQDIEKRKTS